MIWTGIQHKKWLSDLDNTHRVLTAFDTHRYIITESRSEAIHVQG